MTVSAKTDRFSSRSSTFHDSQNRWIAKSIDPDSDGPSEATDSYFAYQGNQIVLQVDGEGEVANRYLWGPGVGQILADEQVPPGGTGEVLWTLTDHLNTVRDFGRCLKFEVRTCRILPSGKGAAVQKVQHANNTEDLPMLKRNCFILALLSWTLVVSFSSVVVADSGGIESVGIYNCYTGMPTTAIPFFQACGYNTYQRWDLGWTLNPSHLAQYYADMAEDVARMQKAGFKSYVLLSINMLQRQEGQPEGYQLTCLDPANPALMQERLSHITTTIQKLKSADGFAIGAGDPGGYDTATPAEYYDAIKQIIAIIGQQAPQAKINVNTWGIAAWDHNPSPFTTQLWQKEVELTNDLISRPDILGPNVSIEYPMHNYYRSLALSCYAQAGVPPLLCPTADQVAAIKQRGVTRQWGWPYFLTDECDDGNSPGTAGAMQAEARYIKQAIDKGRQLGLNGMVANAMASNILPESLNLYAFGRFSNDQTATPDEVISEFAGFVADDKTKANLAQVLKFVENNSTWQAGLPAQYRLADFDVGTLKTAVDAYDELNGVGVCLKSRFPLPDTPIAYLAKVKERLRALGGDSIPGALSWTVSARHGAVEDGTVDGVDADHNLSFTASGDVTNLLRKNDSLRCDLDSVGVTIRNFVATTDRGNWAVAGLVISASSAPSLVPSEPTYSFVVSRNGNSLCYTLSGADGFTTETSQRLSTAPTDFRLDIVRSGNNYVFQVNGEEIFRDSTYGSVSMPHFFVEWGSGSGGVMAMNADHFGIVPERPTWSPVLAAGRNLPAAGNGT